MRPREQPPCARHGSVRGSAVLVKRPLSKMQNALVEPASDLHEVARVVRTRCSIVEGA